MAGKLKENYVFIKDQKEASRIYNKGYYGEPQSHGSLKLTLFEASFLLELGRLEIIRKQKLDLTTFISYATKHYPEFGIKYIVYRDFRQRGYIIKSSSVENIDFEVFARGALPTKTKSRYWVIALSERAKFRIANLANVLNECKNFKKELLIGIVDEEGDLTYYRARSIIPRAKMTLRKPSTKSSATFLKDRTIVWNDAQAEELLSTEFYGKPLGRALQLSLTETSYLVEQELLEVKDVKTNKLLDFEKLIRKAKRLQPGFELSFAAYKDMKKRGLLVKTGFKYGTHFRVYDNLPEKAHSKYLVHAVPESYEATWPEISRAVRLAHGVRKELLLARVCNKKVEYIRLERVRP
jgi:tRNA-intron endonuclease